MKTFAASALAFLSLLSVSAASAAVPEDGSTAPKKTLTAFAHKSYMSTTRPNRLNVIILKQEAEPVHMRIVSASGEEVYRTSIVEDSVMRPFNLTSLEPGTYAVELRRGGQTEVESVTVR